MARRGRPRGVGTCAADLAAALRASADRLAPPERRYATYCSSPPRVEDVVRFAHEAFALDLTVQQRVIVDDVLMHLRCAFASGHRIGKSTTCAVLALWFYCSFPGARVIITANTMDQIRKVIWREIQMLFARAVSRGFFIPGTPSELPGNGIVSPIDYAEVKGLTADQPEAMQGIHARHMLIVADEASGIEERFFRSLEGNRAGGDARMILIGNPTRREGKFFDVFDRPSGFHTRHLSSRESPLVDRAWIAEREAEHGADSDEVRVRVDGMFPRETITSVVSDDVIASALARRGTHDCSRHRLILGCDPAGETEQGDETGFAVRRGGECIEVLGERNLDSDRIFDRLCALVQIHRRPHDLDLALVVLDASGRVGTTIEGDILRRLNALPDSRQPFTFLPLRMGEAPLDKKAFGQLRDEVASRLVTWLQTGAVPQDPFLIEDLRSIGFARDHRGRSRMIEKRVIRQRLGRSPDRGDALALAVYPVSVAREATQAQSPAPDDMSTMSRRSDIYGQGDWLRY